MGFRTAGYKVIMDSRNAPFCVSKDDPVVQLLLGAYTAVTQSRLTSRSAQGWYVLPEYATFRFFQDTVSGERVCRTPYG